MAAAAIAVAAVAIVVVVELEVVIVVVIGRVHLGPNARKRRRVHLSFWGCLKY